MVHETDAETGEGRHENIWDIMHFHEQAIQDSNDFVIMVLVMIFLSFSIFIFSAYIYGVYQEKNIKRFNELPYDECWNDYDYQPISRTCKLLREVA